MKLTDLQVEALLHDLCVELGFCLPKVARARFIESHSADAHTFASEVFKAERLDPRTVSTQLVRKVEYRIEQAFISALAEVVPGSPSREA